ncbi:hypothetical protein scyTo_0004897 [Scyliorhinus torazame]|uniref:Uncharacterized protein n=1 Tax=Scyliorhinus torazame TaxID=75743 RepID=A0A401NYX2_SCYTO|nr:hypothetical protein [Scyliorhinus torazame]
MARDLHPAGVISDGDTVEKASLERQIWKQAATQRQIAWEHQYTSNHLHEIKEERQRQQRRKLLTKQEVVMKENAGTVELQEQSNNYHNGNTGYDDTRIWPGGTVEGLKLSHHFAERIICGKIQNPEAEELVQT